MNDPGLLGCPSLALSELLRLSQNPECQRYHTKHPGDIILDDSETFDHKGERLETEELSSKLEEQLKKIELGEAGLHDISQSDEEKHDHKGGRLESEELESKLKERLKKIDSGQFLDT